jgi:DNA invertase Pin-like site-specific DNA recombinase
MSRPRCALYTRKSTEDGLDQPFNSLDAQREACEAYVLSQAGEGWTCLKTRYDDGGFSGGTMERPGLEALLADIKLGKISVVVVYKVDRLTRSLADFARLVELFDTRGVSFVSVTQQFNTTSSMGRLTLNVLLSFAQFEREVTAERVRDKIGASKRKGLWMGGVVPLGYAAIDRKLVVDEAEAETLRTLFRLYLKHANVRLVKQDADRLGLRTKARKPHNGRRRGGAPFTRGHIYQLLANPIYLGEIVHKGLRYPGQHEAIIHRETWEAVQAQLKRNAVVRRCGFNTKTPSLLAGLLVDEDGERMTPSHASKAGRRYRYYVSRPATEKSSNAGATWRLPAKEIEGVVLNGIGVLLRDRLRLIECLKLSKESPGHLKALLAKAARLTDRMTPAGPAEQREFLLEVVDNIEVREDRIRIVLRAHTLRAMMGKASPEKERGEMARENERAFTVDLPVMVKRRGAELKLVVTDDRRAPPLPDAKLIAAVAQGSRRFAEIRDGNARSVSELARRHGVDRSDVGRMIRLAFLAPDIVEAILEGRQPVDLTAARLTRLSDLPVSWAEQRRLFGLAR